MLKTYLASPYSGTIQEEYNRFHQVCKVAGRIISPDNHVFSPISHSHPIAVRCDLPVNHDYWLQFNRSWIEWADEIAVAMIPGWDNSKGVNWEIAEAERQNKPVRYLEV
jgi:hypothetical protein